MQVPIDVSLLTPTSAVGRVSGPIELTALPRVGDLVSLERAANPSAGFSGQLAVTDVLHVASDKGHEPMLALSDVVSPTEEAAAFIGKALERHYGLFFETYAR